MKKYINSFFIVSLMFSSLFFVNIVRAVTENITQINFITPPQTIDPNTISGILTIETQNASGVEEQLDTSGTVLNLSSSSSTGEFSSSATTWNPVLTLGMNKNWAHRNFYYRDSTPGTHTLTISVNEQTWVPAVQTIVIKSPVVIDTIPPILYLPSDITEETSSPNGMIVNFIVSASDTDPLSPEVSCVPNYGTNFAIGETTVNCSTVDTAGNTTIGSFKVNIKLKEEIKKYGSYVSFPQVNFNIPKISELPIQEISEISKEEVLGAEKFNFINDLYFGVKSAEVVELQKFLINKGYLKAGAFGGFFGKYTKEAVEKFQKANPPLWVDGIVGQETRAVLNK